MKITDITIRHLKMTMKSPFTTSFGTFKDKEFLLLEAKNEDGTVGWGNLLHLMPLGITKKP